MAYRNTRRIKTVKASLHIQGTKSNYKEAKKNKYRYGLATEYFLFTKQQNVVKQN
jgi:hypothetical protein